MRSWHTALQGPLASFLPQIITEELCVRGRLPGLRRQCRTRQDRARLLHGLMITNQKKTGRLSYRVSRGDRVLGLLILEHLQGNPLTLNTKHSPVPKKHSLPPNLFLSLQSVDR